MGRPSLTPIVVLGATGSIGTQTLEVADRLNRQVVGIATGSISRELAAIAERYPDARVAVAETPPRSIDPALVGTRHDLARCYRTLLAGETLSDDKMLTGWRGALLGDMLRSFLAGATGITLCWDGDRLRGSSAACTSDSEVG